MILSFFLTMPDCISRRCAVCRNKGGDLFETGDQLFCSRACVDKFTTFRLHDLATAQASLREILSWAQDEKNLYRPPFEIEMRLIASIARITESLKWLTTHG